MIILLIYAVVVRKLNMTRIPRLKIRVFPNCNDKILVKQLLLCHGIF